MNRETIAKLSKKAKPPIPSVIGRLLYAWLLPEGAVALFTMERYSDDDPFVETAIRLTDPDTDKDTWYIIRNDAGRAKLLQKGLWGPWPESDPQIASAFTAFNRQHVEPSLAKALARGSYRVVL